MGARPEDRRLTRLQRLRWGRLGPWRHRSGTSRRSSRVTSGPCRTLAMTKSSPYIRNFGVAARHDGQQAAQRLLVEIRRANRGYPARPAPAEVEREGAHQVRPGEPRDPAAHAVEERGAVEGDEAGLREVLPRPAPEPVCLHDRLPEVGARQHPPAQKRPDDPDSIPHEAEAAEVGAGVGQAPRLACVGPSADREQMGCEGEEEHRAECVADVCDRVRPVADREADRPHALAADGVDQEADQRAEHERVGEPHTGPRPVELSGIVSSEQPDSEDVDPVDEPLGEEVWRIRAEQERDERDATPEVPLQDVGLEIVCGPAHRKRRRRSAGRIQTPSSRKPAPTRNE